MNQCRFLAIAGILLVFAALFALSACGPTTPTPTATPSVTPSATPSPTTEPVMELGLNSINDPVEQNGDAGDAADIGASRDRWVVEWFWVEQPWRDDDPTWGRGKGEFGWQGTFYLSHFRSDLRDVQFDVDGAAAPQFPNTLVTLHGIPRIYDCVQEYIGTAVPPISASYEYSTECDVSIEPHPRIEGLFEEPVVDGTINPDNHWAHFVFASVDHLDDYGITHYQLWNEPDRQWRYDPQFPDPGAPDGDQQRAWVDDYLEMITAGGDAARLANSGVTLVLGAPSSDDALYAQPGDPFYDEADPNGPCGWIHHAWIQVADGSAVTYLNAVGTHAYEWPFRTWSLAERARKLIPGKPIWVTETGLDLCPAQDHPCGNEEQQAAYVIQQYTYARLADVEVNYHFRAYDFTLPDGTELNFGLRHSPGDTPRPAVTAMTLATEHLASAVIDRDASQIPTVPDDTTGIYDAIAQFLRGYDHTRVVFNTQDGQERITVLWANWARREGDPADLVALVPAWSGARTAKLVDQSGEVMQEWQAVPTEYPIHLDWAVPLTDDPVHAKWSPATEVGGPVYFLIESREESRAPTGSISPVCAKGQLVGLDLTGCDEYAGLATLSVTASPERVYDLSWTQPGRTYAGTVGEVPPQGGTALFVLTNKAGQSITRTFYHDPDMCKENGGGSNPGGDHPDDNHSAASPPIPSGEFFALPEGARAAPRVAILNRGASHELWLMVLGLGEPAARIDAYFDPVATVEQYPVLLVPSGGLYGLENSASFRAANQRISESANHHQRPPHRDPVSLHGYTLRRRYARFVIYHLLICHSSHLPDLRHRLT